MKRLAALGLILALLVVAGLLRKAPPETPRQEAESAAQRSASGEGATDDEVVGMLPPTPRSLRGTTEDGSLTVDADGRFVATRDALDLFDYYLSAVGEESDAVIQARIVAAIRGHLDAAAAVDAEALLGNYLDYRSRAADLLSGREVGEDLERRLQYIRELRREVFGAAVAEALFADEEARWFVELERQRVLRDPDLEAEERSERLAAIDEQVPPEVRAAHDEARAHVSLRREERRLRKEGAGSSEIAQFREERFGPEAAQRLASLDRERAEFEVRLERYRLERDRLLEDASPENAAALVETLRVSRFEGGELVRVRALDQIELRPR